MIRWLINKCLGFDFATVVMGCFALHRRLSVRLDELEGRIADDVDKLDRRLLALDARTKALLEWAHAMHQWALELSIYVTHKMPPCPHDPQGGLNGQTR